MKNYETVIGLEVHLQLNTKTKIFCGCANTFGQNANTLTCPICLGLPGTLPVFNKEVLKNGIRVGLALNCKINSFVKFDRKNYYYPDLPKAYQISQYDFPIAKDGYLPVQIDGQLKNIGITRAHMEEDAGKLIHDSEIKASLVDYNRTGTPLVEIVSEPDIRSPQEAYDYLTSLKLLMQYLDVSDCDMEKGSLRCDANISLRKEGAKEFGTKAEVKNLNSFKAVKSALEFEVGRQKKLLDSGERVVQETRLWDEAKQITLSMRSKEEAHDYRYFPEPDLVPFTVDQKVIDAARKALPEFPLAKSGRFIKEYGLSEYDADVLIQDKNLSQFFEDCIVNYNEPKKICNWISGALKQELNAKKINFPEAKLSVDHFISLIQKVDDGTVSNLAGKDVLKIMLDTHKDPNAIISNKGLAQVSDEGALENIIAEVVSENPQIVEQIKLGKESAIGFLVGQSMRKTQGKANPKIINQMLKRRILDV
ncbi:MAG: Asp-tRNA(Asn)/Glu-tRNA(Gln) amidotransferase subunit GatB [Candidatus Aceula meridiana]|nr:Asp-tRNA(Asn)/Glu-tRNA(Gln) amidotransferase subunit GatB [Candidatus Aceula meridiana]